MAVADFDRDGRLDLAIQNLEKPAVLLMGRGEAGHWLQVSLETARGSRDAIGARVIAHTGGRRQLRQVISGSGFLSQSSRVLHFGLGDVDRVEKLEIHWPSGQRETLHDVAADQRIVIREGEQRASAPR